jgi:hypothetical protein
MRRSFVSRFQDVVEHGCRRLQYALNKRQAPARFRRDIFNAGDHLRRAARVNDANVAEEVLEFVAEMGFRTIPYSRGVFHCCGGHATEQVGLQDVIACERLAPGVQDREYAMCAVDACRRHHHHMAFVE